MVLKSVGNWNALQKSIILSLNFSNSGHLFVQKHERKVTYWIYIAISFWIWNWTVFKMRLLVRIFVISFLCSSMIISGIIKKNEQILVAYFMHTNLFFLARIFSDVSPRIAGGRLSEIIDFPFVAFLRVFYRNEYGEGESSNDCTATIIGKEWILTSARCFKYTKNQIIVCI